MTGVLLLADARFPAGGHANSAGIESAVRCGDVHDTESLERYLAGRLATSGVVDAAFAARACAATQILWQDNWPNRPPVLPQSGGPDSVAGQLAESRTCPATESSALRLAGLDAEYEARVASPRMRLVSRQLGRQLARAARGVWPHPALDHPYHQPIVLGIACAAAGGTPDDAAKLAVHHLAGAITTAAVRMLGLDPLSVAAVQARATTSFAYDPTWATCDPADLPALTGTLAEILAEDHGRWDARLFVA
jgi:urease accessory protein